MRRTTLTLLIRPLLALGATISASTALAQSAPPAAPGGPPPPGAAPSTFPETPLGRLGRDLVAAVNSGDSATITRFVSAHVGTDVLRGHTADVKARMLTKAYTQSGGLEVERVRMFGEALRILTRARNGRRWLGLELEPAANDSTRIAMIGLFPMDNGGMRLPPAPWASGRLGDDQIAAVIREKVRQAADSDKFSGTVLVAHGDRVLVNEVHGFADQARHRPNTRETLFGTTSVGKMFTGVAIAQLVERGLLRFDDTLANVLPAYPNRDAARRITIRQLLSHTAGVPEPFLSPRFGTSREDATHQELLATFAGASLDMTPGARFQYSNGNFATLAAIIEKVSGQRYEEYLRQHVWGPAGMRHVQHPAWTDTPDHAVDYARFTDVDPLGLEPRRPSTGRAKPHRGELRGFGGGAYTAEDLFRFARALRTGKLLRPDLRDSVTTGKVEIGEGAPVKYAFGFYEQRMHDTRVVGHPGSNPDTGEDADVEMVWDGEWTVVVLSNYDAPAGIELSMPIVDMLADQTVLANGAAPRTPADHGSK
jgi:D-alanyl-D-alanine carboxypeptidase